MGWLGGKAIYFHGVQTAEIVRSQGQLVVRNLRPNGTIGVCFRGAKVKDFLDTTWPGWKEQP